MLFAFNPATNRMYRAKTDTKPETLAGFVAGETKKEIERMKKNQIANQDDKNRYERMARQAREEVERYTRKLQELENSSQNLDGAVAEELAKSQLISSGLVEDFKVFKDAVYVTTGNLSFSKKLTSTKSRSGHSIAGDNIGRFLIRISSDASHEDNKVLACNLTWRLGSGNQYYHHPFISRGGAICLGGFGRNIKDAFGKNGYVGVIDLTIGLLTSHLDHTGQTDVNWKTFVEHRKPLREALENGQPYWMFYDTTYSIERYFKDPKLQDRYNKGMAKLQNEPDLAPLFKRPQDYTHRQIVRDMCGHFTNSKFGFELPPISLTGGGNFNVGELLGRPVRVDFQEIYNDQEL